MQRLPTRREALGLLQITRVTQKKENAKDQEIKEKHKQCLQWQSCFCCFKLLY